MIIKRIEANDTIPLRHKVLWPSKPKTFCRIEGDETANHYGLFIKDNLIAVASTFYVNNTVQLRKFAVDENHQSKGYGSQLLRHIIESEKQSYENTKHTILFWCDARVSATEFYQRFGLSITGDIFYKSDEPYLKMSLHLQSANEDK